MNSTVQVIKLKGILNANQAEAVIEAFRAAARQGAERLVVDLADVPLIDSRGLAALVAGYKLFGGQGDNFRLAGLQTQPRLVFDLTGFDRVFQLYESVAPAMEPQAVRPPLALEPVG